MTGSTPRRALLGIAAAASFAASARAQTRVTDDTGRSVALPASLRRVVPAGPPATILLYVLAPELLAGWTRAPSAAEREFLLPATHALPEIGRLTGRGGTANLETILGASPDLILDVGTIDPTYASLADRVQAQTGIPYLLLGGAFADTPSTLRRVGALLGRSERAEALARQAEAFLAQGAELARASRPRVYYGRGPAGLETGLGASINMELIEVAGGHNVASEAGRGSLATVSVEQILAWAPEVVLALDPRFAERMRTDPVLRTLPAARSGRVHVTPVLPFGWIDSPPGVNRVVGLPWLQRRLHPGRVSGDPVAEVVSFFRDWYQVPLAPERARALIGQEA